MNLINELLNCLKSIDYSCYSEEYVNALLDHRDCEPFDTECSRVYNEINELKSGISYTEENEKSRNSVMYQAFMIIENNIGGELSEYVSDDFGLIYDSMVIHYRDAWLEWLIQEYRRGKIPA